MNLLFNYLESKATPTFICEDCNNVVNKCIDICPKCKGKMIDKIQRKWVD